MHAQTWFRTGRVLLCPGLVLAPISAVHGQGSPPVLNIVTTGTGSGAVVSTPQGISCSVTNGMATGVCLATFPPSAVVILTAVPSPGTVTTFVGGCSGTVSCAVQLLASTTVTVHFTELPRHTMVVTSTGNGSGSIASTPQGLQCTLGPAHAPTCEASFPVGTTVTISAQLLDGTFTGWSGACSGSGICQVVMNQDLAVATTFALGVYPVVLSPVGDGAGSVEAAGSGLNCSRSQGATTGSCSSVLPHGTRIELRAIPISSEFGGWGTTNCAPSLDCEVTVTQALTVSPRFVTGETAVNELADMLLGSRALDPGFGGLLDAAGNHNGTADLGDLLALIDRTPGVRLLQALATAFPGRNE